MPSSFRHALRQLLKSPGFTAVALLTLALCIGANSAIFSIVHGILLKPYPWPDSNQLVYCYNTYPRIGLENAGVSIPDYLDRRSGVSGFDSAAMYHFESFNLSLNGTPERATALVATPSLFPTLRSSAALGRTLTEEDAESGRAGVVVLSHAFWQARFGGDPKALGQTIRLNSVPYTIVGVMPAWFYFPDPSVQLWVPFVFTPQQRSDSERGTEYSSMIARLKPGATFTDIQRDLDAIERRNEQAVPQAATFWKAAGFGGRVAGFLEQNVANVRGMLWLLQAGVAAALLIGCANVASLLLARAMGRERELAIRAALGAGRGRLIRLLLTESMILFLVGGGLGLLAALWAVSALPALGFGTLPRAEAIQLDPTVFGFTLACALAAGLVFGALPAWSASRGDAATALKEAGTRTTAGRRTQRLRATLVVVEIALAIMLLSTTGLLIKSFAQLQQQRPGFAPEGVASARLSLPQAKYNRPEKIAAFGEAVLARLRALPGVQEAGITSVLPFTGSNTQGSYRSPEIVLPPGAPFPHAQLRSADPGYLRTLGLTLLRGRWFEDRDRAGTERVVVIDRLLADRYWPGADPIGKHIVRNAASDSNDLWTVVGVVAPIKTQNLEETVTKETIYFPFAQQPELDLGLAVRTSGAMAPVAAAIRSAVQNIDPEQPVFSVKTMDDRMHDAAQPRRAPMLLLSVFSGVALLLAALGVYGVLAFSVSQRTAEFGVRLALGASPRNLVGLVVRQGGRLVLVGMAAGLAGYLALSRIISRLLYHVSAGDPATLVFALAILGGVALVATVLPARRATRVDPMTALRAE